MSALIIILSGGSKRLGKIICIYWSFPRFVLVTIHINIEDGFEGISSHSSNEFTSECEQGCLVDGFLEKIEMEYHKCDDETKRDLALTDTVPMGRI
ncbi:hypothetical protein MALU111345_21180 [Marinicrinis lubricantis]